jgi:hypothetical protein
MATYKLIQDIEAEDHILGPLSFRQFVFGLIAVFLGYMCFLVVVKHVAFLLVVFLPPALFCAFFAFPFGGDQPTETWALAKLRFWFKPRKRLWNQSGLKELVTITVPKKIERVYSDGLSQSEVKSRLQILANTIDSRGWAIKHINALGYMPQQDGSDRLIGIPDMPAMPDDPATTAEDMMDTDSNPIAQQFDSMITKSSQDRRQRLMEELQRPVSSEPEPQWFMNHNPLPAPVPATPAPAAGTVPAPVPAAAVTASGPATMPAPQVAADDAVLSSQLRAQAQIGSQQAYSNLRTLQPIGTKTAPAGGQMPAAQTVQNGAIDNTSGPMTAGGDPAILSLSKNNDLNVATIAREAQRAKGDEPQDEVVISLH